MLWKCLSDLAIFGRKKKEARKKEMGLESAVLWQLHHHILHVYIAFVAGKKKRVTKWLGHCETVDLVCTPCSWTLVVGWHEWTTRTVDKSTYVNYLDLIPT